MNSLPKICIVDTNVAKIANRASAPDEIDDELIECVEACVLAIDHVVSHGRIAVDDGDEIFSEYRQNLSMSGQPGIGDRFMKWVHDNAYGTRVDRVAITKAGESYSEFPKHSSLCTFDISDRKFVAVACAHSAKPPILQAVDVKWWGWKDALAASGVTVVFLSPVFAESKYKEKMGSG